jgi:hypothetical protein
MCHISAEVPVPVVPFPSVPGGQRPDGGGLSVADAVDRYLDGIRAATTRAGYAETLARLAAIAGSRDAGTLQPADYAAVMARWDGAGGGHLEPAPVRARLFHRLGAASEGCRTWPIGCCLTGLPGACV